MSDKQVLTLEHVAAYLPFQVKILTFEGVKIPKRLDIEPLYAGKEAQLLYQYDDVDTHKNCYCDISAVKLILRPMSEAIRYLVSCGMSSLVAFDIHYRLYNGYTNNIMLDDFNLLLKAKFDVFDLIPQGIAVSCNDVGVSYE